MISRRDLLTALSIAALAGTLPLPEARGIDTPGMNWLSLDSIEFLSANLDRFSEALGLPQIELLKLLIQAGVIEAVPLRKPSVVPSPSSFGRTIPTSQTPVNLKESARKRIESLGTSPAMLRSLNETIDRGAIPISISLYGIIFRYSIFAKLRTTLAIHRNWNERFESLNQINKRGTAIALGNSDGLTGAYLFSSMHLASSGPEVHSQVIAGKRDFNLRDTEKSLKLLQKLLKFTNRDVSKISTSDALNRLLEGRSAMTVCWTPNAASQKAWDAQDLGFATLNPSSTGSPSKFIAEGAVNSIYFPSDMTADSIRKYFDQHFSDFRLLALSSVDLNSYYLTEKLQLQWPGIASQLSNLKSLRIQCEPSLTLSLSSSFVIDVLIPSMSSFLEKPTDKMLSETAKKISNS